MADRWRGKALMEMAHDPDDRRHGSVYGYNLGCRCPMCRRANRLASREWRATMRKVLESTPDHRLHGNPLGYSYGCRCERCKTAGKLRRIENQVKRAGGKA